MHLLVNELCEYQNGRCNDKNYIFERSVFHVFTLQICTQTFLGRMTVRNSETYSDVNRSLQVI